MKRLLALLIATTMILSLAACGNSNTAGHPGESAPQGSNSLEQEQPVSAQVLFNGSSTLAPVISAIALSFNETYGTWDQFDPSLPQSNISI